MGKGDRSQGLGRTSGGSSGLRGGGKEKGKGKTVAVHVAMHEEEGRLWKNKNGASETGKVLLGGEKNDTIPSPFTKNTRTLARKNKA